MDRKTFKVRENDYLRDLESAVRSMCRDVGVSTPDVLYWLGRIDDLRREYSGSVSVVGDLNFIMR